MNVTFLLYEMEMISDLMNDSVDYFNRPNILEKECTQAITRILATSGNSFLRSNPWRYDTFLQSGFITRLNEW